MVAELADSGVNIHIDFSQFRTAPPPPLPLVSEGSAPLSPAPLPTAPLSPAPGSPSKAPGKGTKKGNRASAASPTPQPPQPPPQAAQRTAPQVLAAKLAEKITEANVRDSMMAVVAVVGALVCITVDKASSMSPEYGCLRVGGLSALSPLLQPHHTHRPKCAPRPPKCPPCTRPDRSYSALCRARNGRPRP